MTLLRLVSWSVALVTAACSPPRTAQVHTTKKGVKELTKVMLCQHMHVHTYVGRGLATRRYVVHSPSRVRLVVPWQWPGVDDEVQLRRPVLGHRRPRHNGTGVEGVHVRLGVRWRLHTVPII